MEILKQRILKDGVVKEGNVLKVDKFLNHQMDVKLFNDIGEEFAKRFARYSLSSHPVSALPALRHSILTTALLFLQRKLSVKILTAKCSLLR